MVRELPVLTRAFADAHRTQRFVHIRKLFPKRVINDTKVSADSCRRFFERTELSARKNSLCISYKFKADLFVARQGQISRFRVEWISFWLNPNMAIPGLKS